MWLQVYVHENSTLFDVAPPPPSLSVLRCVVYLYAMFYPTLKVCVLVIRDYESMTVINKPIYRCIILVAQIFCEQKRDKESHHKTKHLWRIQNI